MFKSIDQIISHYRKETPMEKNTIEEELEKLRIEALEDKKTEDEEE